MQLSLSFQATFHYTCTKRVLSKNENPFAWQGLIKIMGFGAGFDLKQIKHHLLTFLFSPNGYFCPMSRLDSDHGQLH